MEPGMNSRRMSCSPKHMHRGGSPGSVQLQFSRNPGLSHFSTALHQGAVQVCHQKARKWVQFYTDQVSVKPGSTLVCKFSPCSISCLKSQGLWLHYQSECVHPSGTMRSRQVHTVRQHRDVSDPMSPSHDQSCRA